MLFPRNPLAGFPIEIHLVAHDQTSVTVDQFEKADPVVQMVSTASGTELKKIGINQVCWARNVLVDGKPAFEIYHEGKYVSRLPKARLDLAPGTHTLWPGDHKFEIGQDGKVIAGSPELTVVPQENQPTLIRVKCYPVRVLAKKVRQGSAEISPLMSETPLPSLAIRETANVEEMERREKAGEKGVLKPMELLPLFETFASLTVWLPANRTGKGYLIHPVGVGFHLDAQGAIPPGGIEAAIAGITFSGHDITLSLYDFTITGEPGAEAMVQGVEKFSWSKNDSPQKTLSLYPRTEPYEFRVAAVGPNILIDPVFAEHPVKAVRIEARDPALGSSAAVLTELPAQSFSPGSTVRSRIRAIDSSEAQRLAAPADSLEADGRRWAGDIAKVSAKAAELAKALQMLQSLLAPEAKFDAQKLPAFKSAAGHAADLGAWIGSLKETTAQTQSILKKTQGAIERLQGKEARALFEELAALFASFLPPIEAGAQSFASSAGDVASLIQAAEKAFGSDSEAEKTATRQKVEATLVSLQNLQATWKDAQEKFSPVAEKAKAFREAVYAAVTELNPLKAAEVYGEIQPYRGGDSIRLKLERGEGDFTSLHVPETPDGLYRLRLGVIPPDRPFRPLLTEQWVTLARPSAFSAGLFTPRGRTAFYRGESFWIGLGVLAKEKPLSSDGELEVTLEAEGRRYPILREKIGKTFSQRETFVIELEGALTAALSPGRYQVEARIASQPVAPLELWVVDPTPRTSFTNILYGKYCAFNDLYTEVLRTGKRADEVVGEIRSAGFNAFKGMIYDTDRVFWTEKAIEDAVRSRPELGPWESFRQPSGRDRFLDACVRHNIRFYEDIFNYNDTSIPKDPTILDTCERFVSLEVASMRHSPAFRGVCLYDEIYGRSLIDPSGSVALFDKAQEVAFREKHGGLTGGEAMRAMDRFTGRPFGQRRYEDLEKFRKWPAHEDSYWRLLSERMNAAAKDVMPNAFNFTLMRFWGGNGGNIAPNGTPHDVLSPLDAAACVMYKDGGYGDRPVFAPMQADAMRVRDGMPVWTLLHSFGAPGRYGRHLLRQVFLGLSQKIEGLSYFTLHFSPDSPDQLDNRDTLRDIAERLLTPYGDFFASLDKGYRKVAVYYSRQAAYLAPRKPNQLSYQCEGLWVACIRAGFPADFLYDHQIVEGKGMDYEVVFVPGITYEDECPQEILKALQRLVSAGKTVIVERSSKLPIEGILRLDSELDEYDDKLGGNFPRYVDFETEAVWEQSEETTKLVRVVLEKRIPPAAQHGLIIGPDWLRKGQAEYLVVANFAPTGFSGLYKTLYQAPDQPLLRFPKRPPVCYDVLEMKRQEVQTDGDWMSLQADLRHSPGKIYAFLPSPIERVVLRAAAEVTGGQDINYQVEVHDASGRRIEACFPIEIRLAAGDERVFQEIYRSAVPEYLGVYRMPANVPAGEWKLSVRELISGAVAEATIRVKPGTIPMAKLDRREMRVHDAARIQRFLAEKAPIFIPVEPGQDWLAGPAKELAARLAEKGREAKVVSVDEVIQLPGPWDPIATVFDGLRLWRGNVVRPGLFIQAPVILMGRRGESRLIESLLLRDALAEPISENFPGSGKALLAWTRRAFSNQHDTLTILANDEEGIRRGIDALLSGLPSAEKQEGPPNAVSTPIPLASLTQAAAHKTQPSSFREALSSEDMIRCLDVDEKTGRVLAGTMGYGQNLFCFGPDGKLLWKQFLPEHNVYHAQWYDDGKKIVAATARGFFVFLLEGSNGNVLKKFSATEWPNYHWQEGAVDTEVPIVLNPALRQILIRGLTGLVAVTYEGERMWFYDRAEAIVSYPQEASQTAAAEFGHTVSVGNFALSPDGQKIVVSEMHLIGSTPGQVPGTLDSLWQHQPRLLNARTGHVLLVNRDEPGRERSPGGWWVTWPPQSDAPFVHTENIRLAFRADGKLGQPDWTPESNLKDGGRLIRSPRKLERVRADGSPAWKLESEIIWLDHLDRWNAEETRLYRSDRDGLLRCIDLSNGQTLWESRLPFSARFEPLGNEVFAGTNNGSLVRFDAGGKAVWTLRLRDFNETPTNYPEYVQSALRRDPDSTPEFFPVGQDKPGEYDAILRFGIEQLVNGDFEKQEGWKAESGEVSRASNAHQGSFAVSLIPGRLVTQALSRRVVPSATYLLEFYYKPESEKARLIAGAALSNGKAESLTVSPFSARPGEWAFGRLALKSLLDTKSLQIGFEAQDGPVLLDAVSLRPIRFPSANLLANPELHAIEPTFSKDFRVKYDRIPSGLRDKLMKMSRVAAFRQGETNTAIIYTQEQAFLHNGQIDDVGKRWFYQPDAVGFSMVLTQPAHVSHLVLYLNNAWPETVYPTFSIVTNNMETKIPETLALIRGNRRRFIVVHFPKPYFTDLIKILPGKYRALRDSLTEVEVYGPLGGLQLSEKSFPKDPEAVPMFMGSPSHVLPTFPPDIIGPYEERPQRLQVAPAFHSAMTVADGIFTFANAGGAINSGALPAAGAGAKGAAVNWGPGWGLASVAPTSTPARYAGRLLVGSADFKLHAVADNGPRLWAFKTEGRVYSSPCPDGDDVYFGSDDGRIYKVDVDSGTLIWEFETGGKVRSSPALDQRRLFAASWDGFLYCVDADAGTLRWKAPIAPFTRSSPAVSGGRVFIGDESGSMLCVDAASGAAVWRLELGERISGCPVVTKDGVFFAGDDGQMARASPEGQLRWKQVANARITGQPSATQSQLIVPTEKGVAVLRQEDGRPDERFQAPNQPGKVISAIRYKDYLCLHVANASTNFDVPPRTYAIYNAYGVAWAPKVEEKK